MAKRYKLKKEAKIILGFVIGIIMAIIIGKIIYNDYVYKNSYEYKLELRGYNTKEIKQLIKEVDKKKLDKLLTAPKDNDLLAIINEKYYIRKNLERYLNYYNKSKLEYSQVIALVNANRDYEYYEHNLKTDTSLEELLISNKYYKLAEDYQPDDLVEMKNKYYYGEKQILREKVYEAFKNMWSAANEEGIYLIVNSSYRSFKDQEELYNYYKELNGEKQADEVASRPGYSEHQTGLALDIFSKDNTSTKTFKDSNAYNWLVNNAYKYGFILRYPPGKENLTGYEFEAWHYRYVGEKVAKEIKDKDITFEEYYAYYLDK